MSFVNATGSNVLRSLYDNYSGPPASAPATLIGGGPSNEQTVESIAEGAGLLTADIFTGGIASPLFRLLDRFLPGVTGAVSGVLSPLVNAIAKLFDTDEWKTEGKRLQKLLDTGVEIPKALQGALQLTRGRSAQELIDYTMPMNFRGAASNGRWVNNQFAVSRVETDLRPQDIWGYSTFFEHFGNDWLKTFSQDQRYAIAEKALQLGAVREHLGTIDITWNEELKAAIQEVLAQKGTIPPSSSSPH